ncbi:hypothetical protein [Tsukamurella paurometabola]|uniref:Uncharacterized protein n=1 Tax=Tsukamurella paurometabola TaxID=2061 RepID=A0A3P8L4C7_TSUPA|nr:hypothetical protein [Tsukamurella paurometabola]UEA83145.1 hypothetical protein LK411_22795 [Tsukamurella paurometabola]VDR40235.1 Uncharacterised protein [Tsukamurella paurometabola]
MSRTIAGWAALLAVALGLSFWLGSQTPVRVLRPDGDRLGPQSGQAVAEYLDQARASLAAAPPAERRWALISPAAEWTPDEVWTRAAGLDRVGRVLVRVRIPGVQTPTAIIPTGQSGAGVRAANELAALAMPALVAPGDRGEAIARVTVSRLRAGRPAVVGVVVWGTGDALRAVAGRPGVRSVQVLPREGARFGVSALLPSSTVTAAPGPDDRPVPPR